MKKIRLISLPATLLLLVILTSGASTNNINTVAGPSVNSLTLPHNSVSVINSIRIEKMKDSLKATVKEYPGEIGVAVIYNDTATIVINNEPKYPMMSVFKLHQAIATCNYLEKKNISIDSVVRILRPSLNPSTWSPMLKDFTEDTISISYRCLIRYALEQSDNNASNFLFEHLLSPEKTDDYIATLIPRESFQIKYSESDMMEDHRLAYHNATSPLGAAKLINMLYTDSALIKSKYGPFLRETLEQCQTGTDRIVSALPAGKGIKVGHKTGSGFRDNGILCAHNDVAFIELPDRRHYALAIFVKDFPADERNASEVIARLSGIVYELLNGE